MAGKKPADVFMYLELEEVAPFDGATGYILRYAEFLGACFCWATKLPRVQILVAGGRGLADGEKK